MRNPLRVLLILLAVVVLGITVLSFLPNDRPVRTIEQDVTNTLDDG